MNTQKKKLFVAAMVLSMVAILAIGGTLAYFTAESSANNIFWMGGVGITLDEAVADHITEDNVNWWEADQNDMSPANRVNENTYENVYPGADLPKDPIIRNISSLDAYVRLNVTFNPVAVGMLVAGENLEDNSPQAQFEHLVGGVDSNWIFDGMTWEDRAGNDETTEEMEWYVTLTYYYNEELTGYDADWQQLDDLSVLSSTTPLFTNVHIPESLQEMGEVYGWEFNMVAEAIQSDAFSNPENAWEAYEAQLEGITLVDPDDFVGEQ